MAAIYKTPGVYIEEISKFPPSIAQVETAIPAFIGHTAKADKLGEPITNKPTLVKSIAEFEQYFGKDAPQAFEVTLNTENVVTKVLPAGNKPRYYLYDCLRLYFDNGGGNCYIVSVGNYSTAVNLTNLKIGLTEVAKEDEPTILLSPDAVTLPGKELYEFQKAALAQCASLQDRVVVCDLLQAEQVTNKTFDDRVLEFRSNIGMSELKYGAAYAPWLRAILPKIIRFRDLTFAGGFSLKLTTSDQGIIQTIDTLKAAIRYSDDLVTAIASGLVTGTPNLMDDELNALLTAYDAAANNTDRVTALINLLDYLGKTVTFLKSQITPAQTAQTSYPDFKLHTDLLSWGNATSSYRELVLNLIRHVNAAEAATSPALTLFVAAPSTDLTNMIGFFNNPTIGDLLASDSAINTMYSSVRSDYFLTHPATDTDGANQAVIDALRNYIRNTSSNFLALVRNLAQTIKNYENTFDDALVARYGFYKAMLARINEFWNILPPSSAVAGIYARVDNARGVWKAPANESLNSVAGPDVNISHKDQASLNVDVNAGKSINAIRSFTGKGILVWGARTLAGNDNEWRYISVRRFFNMVEESTKKATEQFVFEPNDANTWVKVQAMIENFLTAQWRAGALAGAKPEHAFFVAIGLGKTMTALDILEGRMIVEIGMAVVRPAEFIVLRFSHKMQES